MAENTETAVVEEAPVAEAPAEEVVAEAPEPKPTKKTTTKKSTEPVWFESREKEPTMFPVADINPIRNFSNGRLEYEVPADDVDRFVQHHFVMNGRIVRKAG
jgi:hypothetical protein